MVMRFKPVPVAPPTYSEYVPLPCTAYRFIYGQTRLPRQTTDIYAAPVPEYVARSPICTGPERMWPGSGVTGYRSRAEKSAWNPNRRKGARTGAKGVTLRDHRGVACDRRSTILTNLVMEG